jgi:hypothetical protein
LYIIILKTLKKKKKITKTKTKKKQQFLKSCALCRQSANRAGHMERVALYRKTMRSVSKEQVVHGIWNMLRSVGKRCDKFQENKWVALSVLRHTRVENA